MHRLFFPEEIWLEDRAAEQRMTQQILNRLPEVPVRRIENIGGELARRNALPQKRVLVLARQDGRFLKPCPGTRNYVCCGYYFLNLATNCDINCSYCILQGYLNNPYMTVYTNLGDLFTELETVLRAHRSHFYRIGTGELTDSLTIDHLTHYSEVLIPFFLRQPNAILDLKTKTVQIQNLLQFEPKGKVIVSWSLNPDELIAREEPNAPCLQDRLEAARVCAERGYLIGFHFDPLIHYPGWEEGYREAVREIFRHVPSRQIVWISLGALRYPAEMDRIVRERHPESRIVLGEMFPGKDGKLRYFRPIREKMFRRMVQWIRESGKDVRIYLCMESPEVWRAAFGKQPLAECGLPRQLDTSVFTCQGLLLDSTEPGQNSPRGRALPHHFESS